MPCNHKFQNQLHLEQIDYEPVTLVVGTFSPALPAGNPAGWFYGKTDDSCFWDVLPRLYGEDSLIHATPADWKQFCRDKQIAITDLISSIDDAEAGNPEHTRILAGGTDKAIVYNFDDFNFVNIVQLLQRHPAIGNVYLTRGITEAFWKHLWNPVAQYCNRSHLHERILLTPSRAAAYQHAAYNDQNPGNQVPLLEDYILMRWREQWAVAG